MFTTHVVTVRTAQLTCSSRRPLSLRSKLQWLGAAVGRLYCPSGIVSDGAVGSGRLSGNLIANFSLHVSRILYMIVKSWKLISAGHLYGLQEAGNHKASGQMSVRELTLWPVSCSWKNKVVRLKELAQDPF